MNAAGAFLGWLLVAIACVWFVVVFLALVRVAVWLVGGDV